MEFPTPEEIIKGTAQAYNSEVGQWARQMASVLKSNVKTMTNETKHKYLRARKYVSLAASINSKTVQRYGEVERVIFPFAKHGFFLAVGASRGHSYKINPRKAVPWYNFLFDSGINELADIVAKYKADSILKAVDMGLKKMGAE